MVNPSTATGVIKTPVFRLFIPAGIVLCFWIILNLLYQVVGLIDDVALYRTLAASICALLFVFKVFVGFFI